MRPIIFLSLLAALIIGCGHSASPVLPAGNADASGLTGRAGSIYGDQYRLWFEGEIFIHETHDRVDVIPRRNSRFHLNALKFLEEYCTDCLKIITVQNNGDSTIDLTVQIKHPFLGFPQYTGFDVKGILMFDGSWTNPGYKYFYPWPEPMRVSWRKLGDPQVLNADGYTVRWSPTYDSGSELPIFNYWEGKYANGTPTANINAYLNFYTNEERHIFEHWYSVTRTYKIWLPPGEPVIAGYAVEACWEPPTNTPVVNPLTDFPPEANQVEAYEFKVWLINDGYITPDLLPCCGQAWDPTKAYIIQKQWGEFTSHHWEIFTDIAGGGGWPMAEGCGDEWPPTWFCHPIVHPEAYPDGDYIGVALNHMVKVVDGEFQRTQFAYTIFEFTVDLE